MILKWAVVGALDWQKHGLQVPAAVEAATREYRDDMNPLTAFIDECCELIPGKQVPISALWSAFNDWREGDMTSGFVSKGNILSFLQTFGVESKKGTKGVRYYVNITIREGGQYG